MDPYFGEIRLLAFTYPPQGWAQCNGQFLPIAQNVALFSLLGTTYGGNGTTTFALPDLRGRVPLQAWEGVASGHLQHLPLGSTGGAVSVVLSEAQTRHSHALKISSAAPALDSPSAAYLATSQHRGQAYSTSRDCTFAADTVQSIGSGAAHNNLQPLLVVNFCIALTGVMPTFP